MSRTRRRILTWLWLTFALAPLALAAAVALLLALGLATYALNPRFGFAGGLAVAGGCFFVTYALALLAHEAGHALAAGTGGWPVRFAHAGPLTLTRAAGGWRLGWDARLWAQGGLVLADLGPGGRWRAAAFIAAGPAANLLLGVAAVPLIAEGLPPLLRASGGLFAVHSLCMAALNLVPHRTRRVDSDGLALWRLLTGGRVVAVKPIAEGSR
jgi:hypothetical protein